MLDIPPERVLQKGRLQPGRMFLVDTRAGPHHRRRGDQAARSPREQPYARVAATRTWSRWSDLPEPPRAARARPRDRAAAAAGLRLHLRGPADPHGADGRGRQRGRRLDGQRRRPGRPLGPAAAALQLFQAALRPGDQSAGRLHPRRDHHVDGDDHRLASTTCSSRRRARARQIKLKSPILDERRAGQAAPARRHDRRAASSRVTLPILFNPSRKARPAWSARWTTLCRQASAAIADGLRLHHPVRPRRRPRPRPDPGAAGRRRRASSPDPRGRRAPRSAWSWRAASRARCITSPC